MLTWASFENIINERRQTQKATCMLPYVQIRQIHKDRTEVARGWVGSGVWIGVWLGVWLDVVGGMG